MYYESNREIQLLREYLRIPAVHPNIDYDHCIKFFKKQAKELNMNFRTLYPVKPDKPVIILTWRGLQPDLPAIMLNSHMDVATVLSNNWIFSPFAADMDKNGLIYGRGIQCSKSVGIQYLAAIRALKREKFQGQRTLYITYMPDSENGGRAGMRPFVLTNFFKKMNVGFVLDAGLASPGSYCPVFYAERTKCPVAIKITGSYKNGSQVAKNTAGEKFNFLLKRFQSFREKELKDLQSKTHITLGDLTTINLTLCNSSGEENYDLPSSIDACFDIRLRRQIKPEHFIAQLNQWGAEAGGGIEIIAIDTDFITDATNLNDNNRFWKAFKQACEEAKIVTKLCVRPCASDARFLRHAGTPTINFSPMPNTPNLLHADNEYLDAKVFLQGIEWYKKIIPALLNTVSTID